MVTLFSHAFVCRNIKWGGVSCCPFAFATSKNSNVIILPVTDPSSSTSGIVQLTQDLRSAKTSGSRKVESYFCCQQLRNCSFIIIRFFTKFF